MRLTTLALLAAHLCATSLLAQTGSMRVLHAPTPTPAPAFKSAPVLAAALAPTASPARLDFPPLFDGDQKTLTVRVTSPAAGYVTGALSDANFRLVEVRAMGAGFETSPAGGAGVAGRTVTSRSTAAPWQVSVGAGAAVEFDVRCAPKFSLDNVAGAKSATLVLTGPGAPTNWRVNVPVAARFEGIKLSLVFKTDGDAFHVVEPDNAFQVPVSLLGFDRTVQGRFRLKSAPSGFLMDEKTFSVPPGGTAKTALSFRLSGVWLGNGGHRPGGEVRVVFEYEGKTSEAAFNVWPHTSMFEMRTVSVGAAGRPGCDALGVEGLVRLSSDGTILLHLRWEPPSSWTRTSSTTVYFAAYFNGQPFAEGYYPKTQQSTFYSNYSSPRFFRTTFNKQAYLPMILAWGDGHGKLTFSCNVNSTQTHF